MAILPWRRARPDPTSPAQSADEKSVLDSTLSLDDVQPQTSALLLLPMEIQQRIYGYAFERWSLAFLNKDEEVFQKVDDTFTFKTVGDKQISGPPGSNLLVVCRAIYDAVHKRYGESCTGVLLLGKIKGNKRRTLPAYLATHTVLKRFYHKIRTLHVYTSLNTGRFGLNFRTLFPNMKHAEILIHEGSYGPMVRLEGTTETFLKSQHSRELVEWTKPIVNHFLGNASRFIIAVHEKSAPWDDATASAGIKVLGTCNKRRGVTLGYHYRWIGTGVKMSALVVREPDVLTFWDERMEWGQRTVIELKQGDDDIPEQLQWVRPMKW